VEAPSLNKKWHGASRSKIARPGAYETVRDRFTANHQAPNTARGPRADVHPREAGSSTSHVMQALDNHDLDVMVEVRKFGGRFDHPSLSAAFESLARAPGICLPACSTLTFRVRRLRQAAMSA